jgi:hypothetical protein
VSEARTERLRACKFEGSVVDKKRGCCWMIEDVAVPELRYVLELLAAPLPFLPRWPV